MRALCAVVLLLSLTNLGGGALEGPQQSGDTLLCCGNLGAWILNLKIKSCYVTVWSLDPF